MARSDVQGRERQSAWLGYKDDRLIAIELEGFHAGETVAAWESRGYRVEQVSNQEAIARWREAYSPGWPNV